MGNPPVKPSKDTPAPTPALVAESVTDLINLSSGEELNDLAVMDLQAARPVRLVVVAGPVMSGKTTLLTSLYELFQWGRVSNYSFAGSKTLPAFERRCYLSRIASERAAPDTARTPYGEVRYLHLQIWNEDFKKGPLDLLFTDVSGESFERARDSITECQRLDFIRQADHFLLLLDSEKLVRREKRWQVADESMMLLRCCLDSGMLNGTSLVNVLFAKFDYLHADWNQEHAEFLDKIKGEFQTEFGARVQRLTFSQIAARPTQSPDLRFGHGLAGLLKDWATFSPRERSMKILPEKVPGARRESELFGVRHFRSSRASE